MVKKVLRKILMMRPFSTILNCQLDKKGNEQSCRKIQSENILKKMNISINKNLPYIETENEIRLRSVNEIVKRIYIIDALASIGHGVNKGEVIADLKSNNLYSALSSNEIDFIKSKKLTQEQKAAATWKIEAAYLLLWSIGKINELPFPSEICNTNLIHEIIKGPNNYRNLISSSELKTKKEIMDISDLIYRTHWAVKNAKLKNQKYPANINPIVIHERHYAINWLTLSSEKWDEITTNT